MSSALPQRLPLMLLAVALVGIVGCVIGALIDPGGFARAWFVAVMIGFQVPLGCLLLLTGYHAMGGWWGIALGDALEAGARLLPLPAVLFLPLLLGLDAIYPWMNAAYLAGHEVVANKVAWLNPTFFTVRSLLYLVIWLGVLATLTAGSRPLAERPLRRTAAIAAALLLALSITLASFDWLMSLEPTFNSSVYGMAIMSAQAVGALALAALVTLVAARREDRIPLLRAERLDSLGGLMQGLLLLWVYMAFMQLLVIWSGNLPHNAEWYLVRIEGVWLVVAWTIGLGHFALPFLMLLSARVRSSVRIVIGLAALLVVMRLVHDLWLILPAFHDRMPPWWLTLCALVAVLGAMGAGFLWLFVRRTAWIAQGIAAVRHG